jgi:hypothetical protein
VVRIRGYRDFLLKIMIVTPMQIASPMLNDFYMDFPSLQPCYLTSICHSAT